MNVHRVSDVRQIEIHTAEVEIAIAKLKRFKSPGSVQIPAELIQAGGEILRSKIHKLIKSIFYRLQAPNFLLIKAIGSFLAPDIEVAPRVTKIRKVMITAVGDNFELKQKLIFHLLTSQSRNS
jgi:hypothetical protein